MYFNPARLGSVVTPLNEEKQNKRSTSIVYFFYFQPVGIALPYCFVIVGAIHSTKLSGNFGPKLNGSVRSNRKSFEKTGPPFEVVLFSRSDRLEFWLNGSRPVFVLVGEWHVYAGLRFLIIHSHPCWAYKQFYRQAIMLHAFYLPLLKNRLSNSSYQFHYRKNTFIFAVKKLLKIFEWNKTSVAHIGKRLNTNAFHTTNVKASRGDCS